MTICRAILAVLLAAALPAAAGDVRAWLSATTAIPLPQHYWPFSETRTLVDVVGGYNGTWSGATVSNVLSEHGAWFPKTNEGTYAWINLPGPITNGPSMSVSAWVKGDVDAMQSQLYGGWIISDRGTDVSASDFQLAYAKTYTNYSLSIPQGTAYVRADSTVQPSNGWTHICGVVDSQDGVELLYVNGVRVATTSITSGVQNVSTLAARIGMASWSGSPALFGFRGYIDFLRFYNRSLTDAEVYDVFKTELIKRTWE